MTLPTKAQSKAASEKEVTSLKKNNVYTLLLVNSVPAGQNKRQSMGLQNQGRRLTKRDALLYWGAGNCLALNVAACFPQSPGSRASAWCLAIEAEYNM